MALAASTLGCVCLAPSAFGLGFQTLSSEPEDDTAGAHSDFTQHIEFTAPGDDVKNLIVHLPPGLVGDPTATPKCTVAQLNSDSCPADTQVGTTTTTADVFLVIPVQQQIAGKVYNLEAQTGEPARFGIVLTPPVGEKVTLQAGASLRQGDFGLDTTINGIPNTATIAGLPVPIDIKALDLTLFGFANDGTADEHSFMRNPTSCGEAVTGFEATSYSGSSASTPATGSASFTPTNCAALDFSPTLSSTVEGVGASEHPEFTTLIEQGEAEAGLRKALVYLPAEVQPSNDGFGDACPLATFQAGNCAAGAIVGSAEASSPLLETPLAGTAYLLSIDGNLGVGLDLQGELSFRLVGTFAFAPDFRTGNLFDNLPDIPIAEFLLTINGGPNGLLEADRDLCGPPAPFLEYTFDGHNGEQTAGTVDSTVLGCAPPEPPTASVTLRRQSSAHPRLRLKVNAGSEALRSARLRLPDGLRFAGQSVFGDGAVAVDDSGELPDDAIERKRRRATTTIPASGGSEKLVLRVGHGALLKTGSGPLRFKIKVIDVDGNVTKLTD
jgi:hypothetical protein